MKDIEKQVEFLEDYGVTVNRFLTIAQIDAIAKSAIKFDNWVEREANIVALTLYFATDIDGKEVEDKGVEYFVANGLWNAVHNRIYNIFAVEEAIDYMESANRAITKLLHTANDKLKELQIDKIDGKKIANQLAKLVKEQNGNGSKK